MYSQNIIAVQVKNRYIVHSTQLQSTGLNTAELCQAPGPVHLTECTPLEEQVSVGWQLVAGLLDQVMEEPDSGEVGFDGGGRFLLLMEIGHIGVNVFGSDVGQTLQAELFSQETAEALHSLIVALPGAKTALPIVAVQLVQLGKKILIMF